MTPENISWKLYNLVNTILGLMFPANVMVKLMVLMNLLVELIVLVNLLNLSLS